MTPKERYEERRAAKRLQEQNRRERIDRDADEDFYLIADSIERIALSLERIATSLERGEVKP